MNRKQKRTEKSQTRKAVRTIAKLHGVPAPKSAELHPDAIVLRIASLEQTVRGLGKVAQENNKHLGRALQMADVHLMVLRRALGEIAPDKKDLSPYYEDIFKVLNEGGDAAGLKWAQGMSIEEAIKAAEEEKSAPAKEAEPVAPVGDTVVLTGNSEPIVELFGGDYEEQSATTG